MQRILNLLTNLFPLWVLLCCAGALVEPAAFTWFSGPYIVWGLGIIMLGMGITLSLDDFKRVLQMPKSVGMGLAAQFILMPACAWTIAKLLNLPDAYKVGLILVACCPGGTASNVVAFLARANVALSVLMTMCSTAAAVVLTPLLTQWLAGQYVPVNGWALFGSMVRIVLLPLVLGVSLHHLFPRVVKVILPVGPLVAVVVIALICASIIGANSEAVRESGMALLGAVVLLHSVAFAIGVCVCEGLRLRTACLPDGVHRGRHAELRTGDRPCPRALRQPADGHSLRDLGGRALGYWKPVGGLLAAAAGEGSNNPLPVSLPGSGTNCWIDFLDDFCASGSSA
jgi:BASS family bile acid:Na+ symporter